MLKCYESAFSYIALWSQRSGWSSILSSGGVIRRLVFLSCAPALFRLLFRALYFGPKRAIFKHNAFLLFSEALLISDSYHEPLD